MKQKTKNVIRVKMLAFILFSFALTVVFANIKTVYALPANPFPFTQTQADGTEITIFFRGDSFFSWWESDEGYIISYDYESANWRYAFLQDGEIYPSEHNVGSGYAFRIERADLLPYIRAAFRFDMGDPHGIHHHHHGHHHDGHGSNNVPTIPAAGENMPATPTPLPNLDPALPTRPGVPTPAPVHTPGPVPGGASTTPQTPVATPTPGAGGGVAPAGAGFNTNFGGLTHGLNLPVGNNNIIGQPSLNAGQATLTFADTAVNINQRLLVLLVEFENMPILESSAFYHNKYFGTAPGTLTIANYFRDMSGGRDVFVPAGRVAVGGTFETSITGSNFSWAASGVDITITESSHDGIVHVAFDMNHPVTAWSSPVGHESIREVVSLALKAIYENTSFNMADMQVAAVIAGGEASDAYNPGGQIWAHAWSYDGTLTGQNGRLRYMAYGERLRNGDIIGIGIAAHELGHVLGLPDLYDITGQSEGVGPYSLMAQGAWGTGAGDPVVGSRPTALDAWSRIQLGFVTPTVVYSGSWQGNINAIGNNSNVIMISSPASQTQHILLENRQTSGIWDAGLAHWIGTNPGGIVIYHIDESLRSSGSEINRNNNNRYHPMVGLREADGSALLSNSLVNWQSLQNHFFTYSGFNRFTAETSPTSHFFDGTGGPNGRIVASGIEVFILSDSGNSMEVRIVLLGEGLAPVQAPRGPV